MRNRHFIGSHVHALKSWAGIFFCLHETIQILIKCGLTVTHVDSRCIVCLFFHLILHQWSNEFDFYFRHPSRQTCSVHFVEMTTTDAVVIFKTMTRQIGSRLWQRCKLWMKTMEVKSSHKSEKKKPNPHGWILLCLNTDFGKNVRLPQRSRRCRRRCTGGERKVLSPLLFGWN